MVSFLRLITSAFVASTSALGAAVEGAKVIIHPGNPLIYYHGRWDSSPGTWWAGSGLKLRVQNLKSLTLNLGPHTTGPFAAVGISVNQQDFQTVNVSAGANDIPLPVDIRPDAAALVRINVQGWQNNRIHLESIVLNAGASLVPYKPSRLSFQFIGDSLSAGQFLPKGVDQAWPFLVGEHFRAEHAITAQPGATLKDMESYGNVHGVEFQFFKTEDTGYFYTTDHNFTTPWNFRRESPRTHVVIHIGANDSSHNVTEEEFVAIYTRFLVKLRTIYPWQPIFVFTPWGWPDPEGVFHVYYPGVYQKIVDTRHAVGDKNVFLVDTTGWVTIDDVFPGNVHPNVPGMAHIAERFISWLEAWGLEA